MARATADRALAHGLLKPELAEDLLGVLAEGTATDGTEGRRPMTNALLRTADELPRAACAPAARAVVMTMGALHEGHADPDPCRPRASSGGDGQVVVTVFVNPLQFGAGEDLDRYPRTLDADLKIAEQAGADVVFAPSVDEVYPGGEPQVRITAGPMGERLEGASRPGHFDGMLTVVAKLLHLTRPDVALFGQKDAQQLALIRRMVRDLNFPRGDRRRPDRPRGGRPRPLQPQPLPLGRRAPHRARPLPGPVRGPRPARRTGGAARACPRSARHARACRGPQRARRVPRRRRRARGRQAAPGGPAAVRAAARHVLDDAARMRPPLALDYLALVDPADFTEIPDDYTGEAVLAVAARVGTTRLIDNIPLTFGAFGAAS